jgi:hypothetical protein
MTRILVRLYPASWRARYGDEFEVLLEERPMGPFDVADILLSAFDAHLRRSGSAAAGDHHRGVRMTLRNGGIAAIVGGGLWLISLAGASASNTGDGQPWLTLLVLALCALVIAIIGLSAEQGRRQPNLIWAAVALPVLGALTSVLGLVGMATGGDRPFIAGFNPWEIWAFGTLLMIIGSGLFALVSLRVRSVSRAGTALLAAGALAAIPGLAGIAFAEIFGGAGGLFGVLGIFAFAAGWIWLGISAIRVDRAGAAALRDAIS